MIRALLALAILVTPAMADVIVVDSSGGGDFVDIQAAVDSATDADVILVEAGTYAGFDIDNKTARLIGSGNPTVQGTVSISDLTANQDVVLSGLSITPTNARSLYVTDCVGAIRVQNCDLLLLGGDFGCSCFESVKIDNADNVSLATCDVGAQRFFHAMSISAGQIATAQSVFSGASAATFDSICFVGGTGIILGADSFLFDSASFAVGGNGDSGQDCGGGGGPCNDECGLTGGNGVDVFGSSPATEMQLLDTVLLGGTGGVGVSYIYDYYTYTCGPGPVCDAPDGTPFANTPSSTAPTFISGTARRSSYSATVQEGGSLAVSLEGEIGDQVALVLSRSSLFDTTGAGIGVRLVDQPSPDSSLYREFPLGTLQASTDNVNVFIPVEIAGFTNETWFAQTLFTDTNGQLWYGPGRSITVLDDPNVPEYASLCNGDGGNQLGCTDCPCGNDAPVGTVGGCINSFSTSARLAAVGSASVSLSPGSTNDLRISVTDAPPTSFCRLVSGNAVAPGGMANPCFGLDTGVQSVHFDGLRCAISGILRHGGRSADANGEVGARGDAWGGEGAPGIGLAGQHGFAAGQTRYFQAVNRDFPNLSCMTGLNTTQAIEVTFAP